MIDKFLGAIGTLFFLYVVFDAFFWSGGVISEPVFEILSESMNN